MLELRERPLSSALADREPPPDVLGYFMQVHCPKPGEAGEAEVTAVDHVKLFRNLAALRFEGRIHEQILLAIRRAGGRVEWTDIFVVHSGSDQSPEGRAKKHERDLRLLQLEDQERPNHPFTLFNLGMTYADMERYDEAAGYLRQSIAASGPDESHLRKAYALLAQSEHRLDRHQQASEVCVEGLRRFPDDAELLFRHGILSHPSGRLHEAV